MTMIQRRSFLGAAASGATGLLGACGGGGEAAAETLGVAQTAQAAPAGSASMFPVPVLPPSPPPSAPAPPPQASLPLDNPARYRHGQRYLFQSVNSRSIKSRLPGGADRGMDLYGPTHKYVDFNIGWPWSRNGGDWIDANLVRHGGTPWFSVAVGAANGSAAIARYSVDVTRAVAHCQINKRWCAMLLSTTGAYRAIAGTHHPSEPAPSIIVTYQNGLQARLACRIVAGNSTSSQQPTSANDQLALPVFTEFEPPAGPVTRAVMHFSCTQHWSGANPQLHGFLLDPPVNAHPVQPGLAAGAGRLDATLAANPQVIGVHRYLDGAPLSDFMLQQPINFYAEKNYDPAIYDTGPRNAAKLPHLGLGKFVGAGAGMAVVGSSYTGDGFAPLAPGLGALRVAMPKTPGIADGSVVGYGGTVAGNAMIFLPESLFGRLPRIFVRYYVRIGGNGQVRQADRKHVYHVASQPVWTDCTGKFGIGADHSTSYGGNSGTSGGGLGWQMRHGWSDCDAETGGPDEGGWAPGWHMYDFYYNNPPGHNYGRGDSSRAQDQWGQQGGLGGMFYAGQWYCVETELKLNTLTAATPGYLADGELRTWIDGRLAYVRTGMVFRTAPVASYAYNPERLRPCRELGVRGLWLNWFHGGKTQNTVDRALFYTGLAWGQQYIGPMNL